LCVDQIDFKNVLLVNLSYLVAAMTFFGLIYLFMGPMFLPLNNSVQKREIVAVVVYGVVFIGLVLVSIFMPSSFLSTTSQPPVITSH